MKSPRENLLSLYRRQGVESHPVCFQLCPALEAEFRKHHPGAVSCQEHFGFPFRTIYDPGFPWNFEETWRIPPRKVDWRRYYPEGFDHGVKFDGWGVAHETTPDSMHMTRMHHPLKDAESLEVLEDYPWPDFEAMDWTYLGPKVQGIQDRGLAAFVWAECTLWETAWYLRGMDRLFIDMAMGDAKAIWLLDKLTDLACLRARRFAESGVDILGLGDDIGMQSTTLMSPVMYREWLKPRLARVIAAAKNAKPDILVSYHSCGFVRPFIGDLVEVGVDILNPVQPECPGMDFPDIHAEFGQQISFNGTIGTQRLMPFGTPDEIVAKVRQNLGMAGSRGGLFCCPTHMLEPEVPWENILAYVEAVKSFRNQELAVGTSDLADNLYPRSTT